MFSFNDFKNFYQLCTRNPFGLAKSSKIKPSSPFVILHNLRFKTKTRKKLIRWSIEELQSLEFVAVVAFLSSQKSNFTTNQIKLRILFAVCNETIRILKLRKTLKSFHEKFCCFSLDDPKFDDVPDPKAVDAFYQVEINLLLESCCNSISKHDQKLFHAIQARLNHNLTSFDEFNLSKSTFHRQLGSIKPLIKSFLYF